MNQVRKYLIYASSIVFSRGLEYCVMLFAAYYLTKFHYGELEYYKKIVELGASLFAFGLPSLIMSYTRSIDSKVNFYFLSFLFITTISAAAIIFLSFTAYFTLVIPFMFCALFFTGGITHSYLLVFRGSTYASLFKTLISAAFYILLFVLIYFFQIKGKAYVYVNYILIGPLLVYFLYELRRQYIAKRIRLKNYLSLFGKLLTSSLTLVLSNFINIMFLYTDIFILKIFSGKANEDIANYGFSLNIAAILLIVPMTLVQVDIERLKSHKGYVKRLNKNITYLVILSALILILIFYLLTGYIFTSFEEMFVLFLLILVSKIFQALSTLYGTMIVVEKRFKTNFIINIIAFVSNIMLSVVLFSKLGIYGVAIASLLSISLRQIFLVKYYRNIINNK